tara:strand:- start:272 stop:907 length:636 start_codon:yes stop_codon:yes gene_type:complete
MFPNVDVPYKQIEFLSDECTEVFKVILENLGVSADIDADLVDELSAFFLRDIYRIDQQQRGSVSLAKYAGYWAFWVRKLKPVSNPKFASDNPDEQYLTPRELKSINEIVSIYFAIELISDFRMRAEDLKPVRGQQEDVVLTKCKKLKAGHCKGSTCFKNYTEQYFTFNEGFFLQYITYSMRNRTFGPHHFALLIESLIYSACPIVTGAADA